MTVIFEAGTFSAHTDSRGNPVFMQADEEYTFELTDLCQFVNWLLREGHLAVDNGISVLGQRSIPRIRAGR